METETKAEPVLAFVVEETAVEAQSGNCESDRDVDEVHSCIPLPSHLDRYS